MFDDLFESGGMLWLPIVAMIIFMVTFAVVAIRTWRRKDRDPEEYERVAALPLEGESSTGGHDG